MAKYPFTKVCEQCNAEFIIKHAWARNTKFCSPECSSTSRHKHTRLPACLNCHGTLIKDQKKFCSQSCAATHSNKNRGSHKPETKLKIKKSVLACAGISLEDRVKEELVPCKACGGPKKHSQKYYCSTACRKVDRTPISPEERRRRNAESQSRYRQKKYRCLAPDADREMIKEIYRLCPEGYEVDHITPLSKGGLHHQDNLQYLPKHENRKKVTRFPHKEYL